MLIQKEKEIKSLDPIWIIFLMKPQVNKLLSLLSVTKKQKQKQKKEEISQIWHGVSKSLPVHLLYC